MLYWVLEANGGQWANQSSRQLFHCKSSPLWLHYFTSATLLQYSWEISISYWPKIASVVSFHLLSGLCWRSDLLWDLQSIAQNASEGFDEKLAVVTGKHPFFWSLWVFSIRVLFKLLISLSIENNKYINAWPFLCLQERFSF